MKIHESLLVVLSEPLSIFPLEGSVGQTIAIGGKRFKDSGLGDWVGFYDWLRTMSGVIVGVRTWLLDDPGVEEIRRQLGKNSAVQLCGKEVRVFFSDDREFDDSKSADQGFGIHKVMSSDGLLALTYDLDFLTVEELAMLRSACRDFL